MTRPTTPSSDPRPTDAGETGRSLADRAAEAAPGPRRPDENLAERQDKLLDEALEETFPASDPIAPKRITK
ncbi:hypothetical protein [Methylobacterium sp. JK268]